jgi:hypothetical protein
MTVSWDVSFSGSFTCIIGLLQPLDKDVKKARKRPAELESQSGMKPFQETWQ